MAEFSSPGVFIEEVPSQVQVTQAVSTSNMGIVGFTKRGPANTATLVTSLDQFIRTFGGFIRESFLPLSTAAFFANGGRRAYVVRVVPGDAVEADALVLSKTTDQQIETGDGVVVAWTKVAGTSLFKDNTGASPLRESSISIRYRGAAAATPLQDLRNRANSADLAQVNGQASYEGRVNPASLAGAYTAGVLLDSAQFAIVPGTLTLSWDPDGGGARTIVFGVGTTPFKQTTTAANGQGSIATLDCITGFLSVKFGGTDIPGAGLVGDLQASFTSANATKTIVDDGAGALTGVSLTAPGTITYADGAYSFTTLGTTDVAHNKAPLLATYKIEAWDLDPVSKGAWANDMKVVITGDDDYLDTPTATYSRFNMSILLLNETSGLYETLETFEELDFDTTTSADYFADVINELSDLVTVNEPSGNEAPGELQGIGRSMVVAGGNELAGGQVVTATVLNGPIAPRSVSITYYRASDNTLRTITDDGNGNLVGNIDSTGTNTVTYASGAIAFKTLETIRGATLVTVSYYTTAEETSHTEIFGDTTKSYTVGTDGTFDATNYGRDQFTTPGALQTAYQGVYALDRIEEIMQVVVPDFAGDETITGDLLDYADSRAALPQGGDRFIILTVPVGSSAQEAVDWFKFTLTRFSKYAALYWPWVKVADPTSNNRPLTMPPMGHIAGIYARTDATKNVGKSPGGTVDGALRFLTGLEVETTQGERDLVYPNKINPLISGPQTGLAVWGVRTISNESEWRYINARRLFMFLERSIFNATHWIVFENNGAGLWGRIKVQLNGFLTALHGEGYFAGTTPAESFFVIVDDSNNDASTIEAGQVIIDVGIAPNKPAEYIRFRMQQISLT
jgi:phage tail sheath protein FI